MPLLAPALLSVMSGISHYYIAMPISTLNFSRAGSQFSAACDSNAQ
jgi:hypothetical protein